MIADQGNTTDDARPQRVQSWPPVPPPHAAPPQPPSEAGAQGPYGPPYGYPYGPGPAGPLPSRTKTVLITLFFGLLGLIPAHLDGKKAEQQGVSPGRYYTAFGITLAVSSVVWTAVVLILVFTVFAAVERSSSGFATTDSGAFVEEPAQGPSVSDFVADWGGPISGSGDRWGGLSLQMGEDGGELVGGVYYDSLGCQGMWEEISRDGMVITVQETIEHDPDLLCATGATRVVQLDAAGQMLVDGGGWSATLTAVPD